MSRFPDPEGGRPHLRSPFRLICHRVASSTPSAAESVRSIFTTGLVRDTFTGGLARPIFVAAWGEPGAVHHGWDGTEGRARPPGSERRRDGTGTASNRSPTDGTRTAPNLSLPDTLGHRRRLGGHDPRAVVTRSERWFRLRSDEYIQLAGSTRCSRASIVVVDTSGWYFEAKLDTVAERLPS